MQLKSIWNTEGSQPNYNTATQLQVRIGLIKTKVEGEEDREKNNREVEGSLTDKLRQAASLHRKSLGNNFGFGLFIWFCF